MPNPPNNTYSGLPDAQRTSLIKADLVDCMVALLTELFFGTRIPACQWFLAKNPAADAERIFRDHRQRNPFTDAHRLASPIVRDPRA